MHDDVRIRDAHFLTPLVLCGLLIAAYVPLAVSGHQDLVRSTELVIDPYQIDLLSRLERMGAALWIQLSHVVVPTDLHPLYYPDPALMTERALLGGLLATMLVAGTVWCWRRKPRAFMGFVVFWAFYAPSSGIEYLPRFTADTYMYLPLFGLMIVVVADINERISASTTVRLRLPYVVASVALFLGLLSFIQAARWKNAITLFEPIVSQTPEAPGPYRVIAQTFLRRDAPEQAREYYERGYSTLYEHGLISREFLTTFEMTGSPERAADVALRLYEPGYPGQPPDGLEVYLTWLVVTHELALPNAPDKRQLVSTLALEALPAAAAQWPRDLLHEVAEHFRALGEDDVAQQYAKAANQR